VLCESDFARSVRGKERQTRDLLTKPAQLLAVVHAASLLVDRLRSGRVCRWLMFDHDKALLLLLKLLSLASQL
jgi:uncharacterized membrane protein